MPVTPLVLIAIFILMLLAGGVYAQGKTNRSSGATSVPTSITVARMNALSKQQVDKMLNDLLIKDVPPQPRMGAMCYGIMPSPSYDAEYICPVCRERTLYSKSESWRVRELDSSRNEARQIKQLSNGAIQLDESRMCKKCARGATPGTLGLTLAYDHATSFTIVPIKSHDLCMLRDFLKGKLSYTTSNDVELPLMNELPRLRYLLGITRETSDDK
ncbi:MAG: hypothetical protein NTX50_29725 [Candidatus Sumerlaeota bacterium]|nr:hypothetical protein [Candidatus Sumerlaeota bacterium]